MKQKHELFQGGGEADDGEEVRLAPKPKANET